MTPVIVTSANPGTTSLVVLYARKNSVQDTSGKNNPGTISGTAGWEDESSGKAILLNGTNTHVTLPTIKGVRCEWHCRPQAMRWHRFMFLVVPRGVARGVVA